MGSFRKSTTSCSSALASSAPATSAQLIEPFESGLISIGLVRGIIRIIRQRKKTIRPAKTTGNQVRMTFLIESHIRWHECGAAPAIRLGGLDPSSSRAVSSTRRISASAARPTSSWRSSGSRVPNARCSSYPGFLSALETGESMWRSLHAKTSTAAAVAASETTPPASGVGFSIARLSSSVPTTLAAIIGAIRCEPQRSCSF